MKGFILKIVVFGSVLWVTVFLFLNQADGYLDPFYLRFTTPKQSSMVLGTSRAAQGIVPRVINEALGRNDLYNYAFTLGHSPYGEVYFNGIRRKLDKQTKNGLFLLTVDPWSLSISKINDTYFPEGDRFLGDMYFVNHKPNFYYLFKYYNDNFYKIYETNTNSNLFLNRDGWLQVNIKWDSLEMHKRLEDKIRDYKISVVDLKLSDNRKLYLIRTIKYLKKFGKVYLIRMPIHPKMMDIENVLAPNFNHDIKEAIQISDGYMDMTVCNNKYRYTDGNHLYKESSIEVSTKIADWLSNLNR